MGIGATAGVAVVGGTALNANASDSTSSPSLSSDALAFDPDGYTELTTTITDADGADHDVTYHFWKAVTYVTDPVDATYQSLVVSVPVEIDGTAVDATDAPILFANGVEGYLPFTVSAAAGIAGGTAVGLPPGAGGNVSLPKLGLAAGYVVVEPGARGWSLTDSSGTYYGTAPSGIVDLKAAVRYVRANKGVMPGNTDRIVSTGTSAGGALSSLLGASGDSPIYDVYLKELGAADASDAVFATGAWCPITDLEHADGAYEFCWGSNPLNGGKTVDATVSRTLQAQFAEYQASLKLKGLNGFGPLHARNLDDYLLETYIQPSATTYLTDLSAAARETYLAANTFIAWSGGRAAFTWADYLTHVGARKKNAPAFDTFDLSAVENHEFGKGTTAARHFTAYGAKNDTTGLTSRRLDSDIAEKLRLMNPMHHLVEKVNPNRSKHWWIRLGTKDSDTSLTVAANLAAAVDNLGDDVNHLYYWDQGHGANTDPGDFITWVAKVTGHKGKRSVRNGRGG